MFRYFIITRFFNYKGYRQILDKIEQQTAHSTEHYGLESYKQHFILNDTMTLDIILSKRGKTYEFFHNEKSLFIIFEGIYMPYHEVQKNDETVSYIKKLYELFY